MTKDRVRVRLEGVRAKIVQKRKELGISQEKFAELAGCTRANIYLLEKGKQYPSLELLLHLSESLDESPSSYYDPNISSEDDSVARTINRDFLRYLPSNS